MSRLTDGLGEAAVELLGGALGGDTIDGESVRKKLSATLAEQKHRVTEDGGFQQLSRDIGKRAFGENWRAELDRLNQKLADSLSMVETTPESKEALANINRDISASANMVFQLTMLFGSISNDNMDEKARQKLVQRSVEEMGPLFVKLLQTAVNFYAAMEPSSEPDDPVIPALKRLQDQVTPMPWETVESRVEASLGRPIKEAYLSFDKEPIASGSIGQAHRAQILIKRHAWSKPEVVDVIVKVLRPGLKDALDSTVRVTQLALAVVKEVLALESESLDEIRGIAQRFLPMIERTLKSFIEAFKIESDFEQEVDTTEFFAKMLAPDLDVVVPEVYRSHSKDAVITMQALTGTRLSKWMQRYETSRQADVLPELRGPLPRDPRKAEPEARQRAIDFAKETVGIEPAQVELIRERKDWWVYEIKDADGRAMPVFVRHNGEIHCSGKLPSIPPDRAEARATKWVERTYGFAVASAKATPCKRGSLVRVEFEPVVDDKDDEKAPAPPRAALDILIESKHGRIVGPVFETAPDLSPEAVAQLRDRLISTFIAQVFLGLFHGDPHEGNFFVMADGRTIALLDYGLSLSLGWRHFSAPMAVLSGALLGKPKMMAKALVDMSAAAETMSETQRAAAIERTEKSLKQFFREIEDKAADVHQGRIQRCFELTVQRLGAAIERAWSQDGLGPAPIYLLTTKAVLAMAGNVAAIDRGTDVPKRRLRSGYRVLRQVYIHKTPTPTPVFRAIKAKKVRRLNAAARAVAVDASAERRPRESAADLRAPWSPESDS
jgi:predicted unusual protein kinase regulating ubiquinone biosynthesis (AarF/ABC1/UbiB family)